MKLSDFHFELPEEQIALYPSTRRSDSRLLCMDRQEGTLNHRGFRDLTALLRPDDLLVFNNTRVIPARLYGSKESGGKIEVLLERVLGENRVLAQIRSSKSPAAGSQLCFTDRDGSIVHAQVLGRKDEFFQLHFEEQTELMGLLDRIGHIPLPPYIKREDSLPDRERYQTVYAAKSGAVAAPTAGLHFDAELLLWLKESGIATANVTLHVGAGTFQPIRAKEIGEHRMHAEYLEVDASVCEAVNACRARKGRVIAVGTTTVRCLETASASGSIQPFTGDTRIFIYPGYQFCSVDALITNFHLPESTLIMLVSAFSSREHVLNAYNQAVQEGYRFFSYGDAMFIS